MTWTFDSTLTGPIRTLIRNAVIARLAPLQAPIGYLEATIPLGFQVRDHQEDTLDLLYAELGGRTPAIAVAILDQDGESAGAIYRGRGTYDVELYVVSSHRRGLTEGRTMADAAAAASNTRDPGIDTTLELVWMLLEQQDLGLGTQVQVPRFKREHLIIASDELTVWRQHYAVIATRDVNPNRDLTQMVVEFVSTLKTAGELAAGTVGITLENDTD